MRQKLIIGLHALLVVGSYTAWLWLDYRIFAAIAVAHLIMLETLRGCPLSHAQFPDNKDKRFYEWWLGHLGVNPGPKGRRRLRVFMQYILPFLLIGLGVVWQVVLSMRPIIGF